MRLKSRPLAHPTCPLCRESVFVLETSACTGCRTHYHLACLEEFTGCSTLGCASTNYVQADLSSPWVGGDHPTIQLRPRPSAVPSRITILSGRAWSALRGGLATLAEKSRERFEHLQVADYAAYLMLFLLVIAAGFIGVEALSYLGGLTKPGVVAICLSFVAFGAVVACANVVSKES